MCVGNVCHVCATSVLCKLTAAGAIGLPRYAQVCPGMHFYDLLYFFAGIFTALPEIQNKVTMQEPQPTCIRMPSVLEFSVGVVASDT